MKLYVNDELVFECEAPIDHIIASTPSGMGTYGLTPANQKVTLSTVKVSVEANPLSMRHLNETQIKAALSPDGMRNKVNDAPVLFD